MFSNTKQEKIIETLLQVSPVCATPKCDGISHWCNLRVGGWKLQALVSFLEELIPPTEGIVFFLYALLDPITLTIRYVGCTEDLGGRFWTHVMHAGEDPPEKGRWMARLLLKGELPHLVVLDEFSNRQIALLAESVWIHRARQNGHSIFTPEHCWQKPFKWPNGLYGYRPFCRRRSCRRKFSKKMERCSHSKYSRRRIRKTRRLYMRLTEGWRRTALAAMRTEEVEEDTSIAGALESLQEIITAPNEEDLIIERAYCW